MDFQKGCTIFALEMVIVRHLVVQPFLCPFVTAYSSFTVANVTLFDE